MEEKEELKPLPCAYCRVDAYVSEVTGNGTKLYNCNDVACEPGRNLIPLPVRQWNFLQEQLLELRRKDFKSGWIARDARHGRELHGEGLKELMCEEYIADGKGDE